MSYENPEKAGSTTPMLDAILAELPPMSLRLILEINLKEAVIVRDRLLEMLEADTLTQSDIERELNSLPKIGGMETAKESIIDSIRMHLPFEYKHDIKNLPA